MSISSDKNPRPTVRHNRARAELGECYCPRCAPALHAQTEPAPTPPPTGTAREISLQSPAMPPVERIAVGGDPRPQTEEEWRAEIERARVALRESEAVWFAAHSALDEIVTQARAAERDIRARQRDLRDATEGRYRTHMEVIEVPRPWIEPAHWRALVEAQRCALALASQMASAGPDWSASVASERAALLNALAALDATERP